MHSLRNVFFGIVIGCLFYLSVPPAAKNFAGMPTTKVNLKRTNHFIKEFRNKHGRVPNNLGELRLSMISNRLDFAPYDGFAARLHYQPLTTTAYILRSYGGPSAEKPLTISNLPPLPKPYIKMTNINPLARAYPASLLEGSQFGDNSLVARLFRYPQLDRKTLVVHNNKPRSILELCPHPGVEEYYWLTKNKIVYTATGDHRREDGLFLWDINKGTHTNLIARTTASISQQIGRSAPRYFLSLAGSSANAIAFYMQVPGAAGLSGSEFYSSKNLYLATFDSTGNFVTINPIGSKENSHGFGKLFISSPAIPEATRIPALKAWSQLKTAGPTGDILEGWQDFALRFDQSPLFPYGLLWLSFLYNDAHRHFLATDPEAAAKLRNFGISIAESLTHLPAIPTYLRAISFDNYDKLANNKGLDVILGDLK